MGSEVGHLSVKYDDLVVLRELVHAYLPPYLKEPGDALIKRIECALTPEVATDEEVH